MKDGVIVVASTVAAGAGAGMVLDGIGGTECLAETICWINKIYPIEGAAGNRLVME